MSTEKRAVVVGGGLAGLACTVKLAEQGIKVDLISMVPVKRSHSVCAQGGINATNDIARQQGYSEWLHFDETVLGGDFLADQPPVLEMANSAPKIIDLLDRMGVPFNRTAEGQRALRMFGGSLFKRTFYSGATTGQQLLYALDEQTRRFEAEGMVDKFEFWEFLWPITEDVDGEQTVVGAVCQDMRTMEIRVFKGDAVVMATGGNGLIFGKSTMSVICTGGAASRCMQAGAKYANPEMMQVHPSAIPGEDKCRLISESARGEGGRVWVPRKQRDERQPNDIPEDERWYFLEEKYPKYGNLVPRDIATREIFQTCLDGYGVGGGNMVYLDLRDQVQKIGRDGVMKKLAGILEIYEKFVGVDPLSEPMKIFPAIHYSMGGLWAGYKKDDKTGGMEHGHPDNMMTNIKGLYAMGEAVVHYHGANRLGANSLLSCIFDGLFSGQSVANYVKDVAPGVDTIDQSTFDAVAKQEKDRMEWLVSNDGNENPYELWQEMGLNMTNNCTVVRYNDRLDTLIGDLQSYKERYQKVKLSDTGMWTNQNLSFARAVRDMIVMAEGIAKAARMRDESRGAHYKPDFPERDDANFLKSTVATYDPATNVTSVEWGTVDTSLIPPRARTYGKTESTAEKKAKPSESDDQSPAKAGKGTSQKPALVSA
ncbi:MAG: succinate dehydrogenase flavoprotein subunit [Planctomycetota bacterium]